MEPLGKKCPHRLTCLAIAVLFVCTGPFYLNAQDLPVEVGIEEQLGSFVPLDVLLIDETGAQVTLGDLIDRPVVLNFVYYRCPGICTPLMNGLASVIDRSDLVPGKDYKVLTISFDPTETPDVAMRKKNNYKVLVKNHDISEGWLFFTADSQVIATLTAATGFKYKRMGNEYLHSGTLIMLSPNGKISRYLNGISFLPLEFKLGILEAAEGKVGPTINRFIQYCFSYDPASHRYVLSITRVAGIFITFFAVLLLMYLIIKPLINRKTKNTHNAQP